MRIILVAVAVFTALFAAPAVADGLFRRIT